MATYKIVCADRLYEHRHITHVGTGPESVAKDEWTGTQVRTALRNGHRFFIEDPTTGLTTDVEPYDAHVGGKIVYTIRSSPDATVDNNLDYIRGRRWKAWLLVVESLDGWEGMARCRAILTRVRVRGETCGHGNGVGQERNDSLCFLGRQRQAKAPIEVQVDPSPIQWHRPQVRNLTAVDNDIVVPEGSGV